MFRSVLFLSLISFSIAEAAPQFIRWTAKDDKNSELSHVIEVLNQKSGLRLTPSDFKKTEDRELATSRFQMHSQMVQGKPVRFMALRIWSNLKTAETIQVEAQVDGAANLKALQGMAKAGHLKTLNLGSESLQKTVNELVKATVAKNSDDPVIRQMSYDDFWENTDLVRVVKATGKRGTHTIKVSLSKNRVVSTEYKSFPQADQSDEISVPALVYPIYEETEKGVLQKREPTVLKYIKTQIRYAGSDPYAPLRTQKYMSDKIDPILGATPEGQAQGYWIMSVILEKAADIRSQLPLVANSFEDRGVFLEGRYATVSITPEALEKFQGINFKPTATSILKTSWFPADQQGQVWEMIPGSSFFGRALKTLEDAYNRLATRDPEHNPVTYINEGFDEIQVYHAINTMFEALQPMGFTDPDFSTRPFHAFLYDPDISSKNNAYYTDDTINFTTYSPSAQNFARDNSTIWHELGHGVMDRMMGPSLTLADTGGLSEGMADFVAALVIERVTGGVPFDGSDSFRIVNNIGFLLTNEVHDDGEAYGGAMRDLMVAAEAKWGMDGVTKVSDLTMETMRLCRNHPGLTAADWFNRMLFADELGNAPVRESGELKDLIMSSLNNRNFSFSGKSAQFSLKNENSEVEGNGPGTRENPIRVSLDEKETATYTLSVKAIDGDAYRFKYPLQVKVQLEGGPIQGAIHWVGQENQAVTYTLNSAEDTLNIPLKITGKCDEVNRDDGSCVDFAYLQLTPQGAKSPIAKKRFYLRLKTKELVRVGN